MAKLKMKNVRRWRCAFRALNSIPGTNWGIKMINVGTIDNLLSVIVYLTVR